MGSKHVLLGVTGSVAAIKVPELVAALSELPSFKLSLIVQYCNSVNCD